MKTGVTFSQKVETSKTTAWKNVARGTDYGGAGSFDRFVHCGIKFAEITNTVGIAIEVACYQMAASKLILLSC